MRLTTAKFYSPHDRTFSKIGVRPDVVVDEVPAQHITLFRGSFDQQFESDKDIQKGLEILRSQLSSP
jgi:C-terminal processing protease CtpA/Prc